MRNIGAFSNTSQGVSITGQENEQILSVVFSPVIAGAADLSYSWEADSAQLPGVLVQKKQGPTLCLG